MKALSMAILLLLSIQNSFASGAKFEIAAEDFKDFIKDDYCAEGAKIEEIVLGTNLMYCPTCGLTEIVPYTDMAKAYEAKKLKRPVRWLNGTDNDDTSTGVKGIDYPKDFDHSNLYILSNKDKTCPTVRSLRKNVSVDNDTSIKNLL